MLLLRILCFGFVFSLAVAQPVVSYAAEAQGDIEARLIDPLRMDIEDAKILCAQEEQLVRCDVFWEFLKEQNRNRRHGNKKGHTQDNNKKPRKEYGVFTATFE